MQNSKCKIGLIEKISQDVVDFLVKERVLSLEGSNNESGKILTILGILPKFPKILWIKNETDEALKTINFLKEMTDVSLYQNVNADDEKDDLKLIERQKILASLLAKEKQVIVADISALFQKIPQKSDFFKNKISKGQKISLSGISQKLVNLGYHFEERVFLEGDFAIHGDVLDVFTPQFNQPLRVELFGSKVSDFYLFDPSSGDKVKVLEKAIILPIKTKKNPATIFDYFNSNFLIIFDEPDKIANSLQSLNILDPKIPKLLELQNKLSSFYQLYFQPLLGFGLKAKAKEIDYYSPPDYQGKIINFVRDLKDFKNKGYQVYIASKNILTIEEILAQEKNKVEFFDFSLPHGLISSKRKIAIFTERDIFGLRGKRAFLTPTQKQLNFLKKFKTGELLVHIDHGIGRFIKLAKYSFNKDEKKVFYAFIEFAENDRLLLPASQAKKISKYIGVSGIKIQLSRLGSPSWQRVKKRISQTTFKIARELLEISALRKARRGFEFLENHEWEKVLEDSFKYQETIDQKRAISAVYQDMKKERPMDRLICGDVGFGKTEVAIRAAARVVANQKQVALICPTTILSEQHLVTFRKRLERLPIRIESLSRFKSRAKQKEIIENLKKGKIDIVIGTHRLLQKDVLFSDLGLVVIDEEQRFGVGDKEKLKRMRTWVDVLTLSATPIPRTLYSALGGLKKISKIQTPPLGRLPIETKITKFDQDEVKKIILSEVRRGGQVYFIHNWVRTIYSRADELSQILPKEIKIGIAHGQMPTQKLARVMADFTSSKYDVLLATTIIENGLDLSNVNTLIVDRAERFGLSELYQLRGRVGRSERKAYAHFLVKNGDLTQESRRRLAVLLESKDLGAGFMVATRDLELRGGGNILGREQSGHIAEVGLNLYSQLLKEAVAKIRS